MENECVARTFVKYIICFIIAPIFKQFFLNLKAYNFKPVLI